MSFEYEDLLKTPVGQANKNKITGKPEKKNKYNSCKTYIDGIGFDSKKEANYYEKLKLRLRAGEIKGFCRQTEFILTEGTPRNKAMRYKADFIVFEQDKTRIIDVKGYKTDNYKLKKKFFESKFDLEIEEV